MSILYLRTKTHPITYAVLEHVHISILPIVEVRRSNLAANLVKLDEGPVHSGATAKVPPLKPEQWHWKMMVSSGNYSKMASIQVSELFPDRLLGVIFHDSVSFTNLIRWAEFAPLATLLNSQVQWRTSLYFRFLEC